MAVAAACAACSAGRASTPSPVATPSMAATTPAPTTTPGVVLVKGTGRCEITASSEETDGGNTVYQEHFRCINTMSDPRLDGTFDADLTTVVEPGTAPTMRWAGPVSIVNAGGSWKGSGRGAVVMWTDMHGNPTNYGVDVYEGQGAYAGLVYHELVAGDNEIADLVGWIEPKT